jgi:hypothetical protein
MIQSKFTLAETQVYFLSQYQQYGFKDKSSLVRVALDRLQHDLELQQLHRSAALYAELYEEEPELRELTESAIAGWPV